MKAHQLFTSLLLTLALLLAVGGSDTFAQDSTFVPHVIVSGFDEARSAVMADFNLDGRMDVASIGRESHTLRWSEQEEDGSWTDHIISTGVSYGMDVVAADVNGDQWTDIVACGAHSMWVWRNQSNENFALSYEDGSLDAAVCVEAGDMDLDGDIDLVSGDANLQRIYWYENHGGFTFTRYEVGEGWPKDLELSPVGTDVHPAIIAPCDDGLRLFIRQPDGSYGFSYYVPVGHPSYAAGADFDGNGEGDYAYIGTNAEEAYVRYFTNNQPENAGEPLGVVTNAATIGQGDLDNDGDIDVVVGGYSSGQLTVFWNEGDRNWNRWDVHNDNTQAYSMEVVDINSDGSLDILCAAPQFTDHVVWWEYTVPSLQPPVTMSIAPWNAPVVVPPGGSFSYNLGIDFNLDQPVIGWVWSDVLLPNGNVFGPVFEIQFLFAPFLTIDVTGIQQDVLPNAPEGDYEWRVHVGQTLVNPVETASFPFVVSGDQPGGGVANGWQSHGHEKIAGLVSSEASSGVSPQEFTLSPLYPNPFNGSCNLTVHLTENASVTTQFVNLTGQVVTSRSFGLMEAGRHELTLSGQGLASGVYLIRVQAGAAIATQKVVVLK